MHFFKYSLLFAFLASALIVDQVTAQDPLSSIQAAASSVASQVGAGATSLASDAGNAATSLGGAATSLGGVATSAAASATHAAGDDHDHTPITTTNGLPSPTGGSSAPVPQNSAMGSSLPAFGLVSLVSGLAVVLAGVLQE